MTARHRAPRYVPVVVAGVVTAATGLALLLAPSAPVAARSGSVLDASSVPPDTAGGDAPDAAPSAPPPVPDAVAPAAAPVGTGVAEPAPVPVLVPTGFRPDRLVIEALRVDATLLTTVVDAEGALVPPDDPAELGWWRGVRPGTGSGSVVVAGHIDSSRYGQGPLARLVDLVPGDRAVLSGPDGARAEYVLRGIETFPKESLPAAELFTADGAERLVLVTCGGSFDRALGSWDSNIVAVLDPVPPS